MQDRSKTAALLLSALLILGFAAYSIKIKSYWLNERSPIAALQSGEQIPSFKLPDMQGQEVDLYEELAKHNLTLISFWATWCKPCLIETPQLARIYDQHGGERFNIRAVTIDEYRAPVERYLQKRPVPFRVLLDADQEVMKLFGVRRIPVTVLVDRQGRIERVHAGLQPRLERTVKWMISLSE